MSNPGGTFNTLGTSAGLRPGTTMRPGSQMRPGTNRMQAAGVGGSLQQPVAVTVEAPVAREGMRAASRSGVGTSAGPGRQVGDRSYYIGLLRLKISELSAEIERLNEQEQLIGQNSSVLAQLQQKTKSLNKQISELKDTLADVNLAVENASSRSARDIKEEAMRRSETNREKAKERDAVFLKAKQLDEKTKAAEQALMVDMQQMEAKIINDNQDFSLYKTTRDEAFRLADEVLSQQHTLLCLSAKQEQLMEKLARDPDKKRASELLRTILRKRCEKEELTKQCSLSVEEERQMLIKQVKTTRSDIEELERQVNNARDALQESKVRLSALEEENRNCSDDAISVIMEVQERAREIDVFMDGFPSQEAEELQKIDAAQKGIATLLDRVSKAFEIKRQMPADGSPTALHALSTEVDAKRDQIENDQKTHQRLQRELLDRKSELEKVASLDKKIKDELASHTKRMAEQEEEMEKFRDLDALRDSVEKVRQELARQKVSLTRQRDTGKHEMNALTAAYEAAKRALNEDDIFSSLSTQEQKLRMLWQSTYSLDEYVRLKEKETQYVSTKADCLFMVDEINLLLKDKSQVAGSPSGSPVLRLNER